MNSKHLVRRTMLASCAISALMLVPTTAFSQDGPAETENSSFGEILVTAQRREERLDDVPISINAFSGDQLANSGVGNTLDLTKVAPGLVMGTAGPYVSPSIRGISTQILTAGADPNVATYLDGVYLPSQQALAFSLPDVERVEVLKGPQGTLFGRNATGGAIRIVTQSPSYELGGHLTGSYGTFNDRSIKGVVSVPIVADKISLGLSGFLQDGDGFIKDVVNGRDLAPVRNRVGRVKLRIDPTENFNISLGYHYSKFSDASSLYGLALNTNTVAKRYNPQLTTPIISTQPYRASTAGLPRDIYLDSRTQIFTGKLEWTIGDLGTLTSLTAHYENLFRGINQTDGVGHPGVEGKPIYVRQVEKQTSQELSFSSSLSGPFNFTIGGYYSDGVAKYDGNGIVNDDGFRRFTNKAWGDAHIKTYAAFAELFYDLTDRVHLIGGLRYSHEKRHSLEPDRKLSGVVSVG